eukprot:6485514-Amphidinium_carterae.1
MVSSEFTIPLAAEYFDMGLLGRAVNDWGLKDIDCFLELFDVHELRFFHCQSLRRKERWQLYGPAYDPQTN